MCVDLTALSPKMSGTPAVWRPPKVAADFLNRLLDGFQGAKFYPNICKIMGYAFFLEMRGDS